MIFKYIVKISEEETKNPDNWYVRNILKQIIDRFNNTDNNNPLSLKEMVANIKNEISEHINKQSNTSIITKTIEYYIGKRSYSTSKYNLNTAYKDISKDIQNKKIDVQSTANKEIQYTYNIDENMRLLVTGMLCRIKVKKNNVRDFFKNHESLDKCAILNNRSREKFIKDISNGDIEARDAYKMLLSISDKNEKEMLEEEFKKYTKDVSDSLKNECICSIRNNIELLDKYGLIRNFVEANNIAYKNIYLLNCDYTYEETMELLSEKSLKKLSIEQLIGMSAYWNNRMAKVVNEINTATYILSHPELYSSKTTNDGKIEISINDETLQNVQLKMHILKKICFETFDIAELLIDDESRKENKSVDINYEVDSVCQRYEKDYKSYLDKKILYSKNELREDIREALEYENLAYNLYAIKSANIQSLLICAANSGIDKIQNFGWFKDRQKDVKNFMLLGIDIPGMNMPLRLHTRESSVTEVLESIQNRKNVKIPKYLGAEDFFYNRREKCIMPTQIYVPISKEKENSFNEALKRINEKDKYSKTIKHIAYIAGKGKMPEHMVKEAEILEAEDCIDEL